MGKARTGSYTKTYDKNGKHIGWKFTIPEDALGGRISGSGRTKKEAREKQAKNVKERLKKLGLTNANVNYDKLTFRELCGLFLSHKSLEVKDSTKEGYTVADKYLFSKLYPLKVNMITASMIDGALTELQEERNLSASTLALYKRQLAAVFNYAVVQEILYTSPMRKTAKRRQDKSRKVDVAVLTEEQVRELLRRAKEDDKKNRKRRKVLVYPLILMGLATGCRLGELLALKYEDIKDGKLTVGKQINPKGKTTTLKTDSSYRIIPILQEVIDRVQVYFSDMGRTKGNDSIKAEAGYILFYPDGSHYTYGVTKDAAKRFLDKNRDIVPNTFTFHDLRHTYATRHIGKGISIHMVSRWLGHKDIAITLNFYANYIPEDDVKMLEASKELLV